MACSRSGAGLGLRVRLLLLLALLPLCLVTAYEQTVNLCMIGSMLRDSCGHATLKSASLALQALNARDGSVVPQLAELPAGLAFNAKYNSATDAEEALTAFLDCKDSNDADAVLGLDSSDKALPIATYGAILKIPQISWMATSTELDGPNYPNFLRTCPTTADDAMGAAAVLHMFQWKKAGVIYTDNGWGNSVFSELQERLRGTEMRLVGSPLDPSSGNATKTAHELLAVLAEARVRVYIVVMAPKHFPAVLAAAQHLGLIGGQEDTAWISVETSIESIVQFGGPAVESQLQGFLHLSLAHDTAGLQRLMAVLDALPPGLPPALWADTEQADSKEWFAACPNEVLWAYDAVAAVGLGAAAMHRQSLPAQQDALYEAVVQQSGFTGASGKVVFDAAGNRLNVTYALSNYAEGASHRIAYAWSEGYSTVGGWGAEAGWPGDLVWPSGLRGRPPFDGICPRGTDYDTVSKACTVVLMVLGSYYPMEWAGIALAAHHVNTRNASIVGHEVMARLDNAAWPGEYDLFGRFQVKLLGYDADCTSETGLRWLMDRCVTDTIGNGEGCAGIVGAACSSVSQPLATIGALYKFPQISPSSSSPSLSSERSYPYFARTPPSDEYTGKIAAAFVRSKEWNNVAFLNHIEAYGTGLYDSFASAASDEGITIRAHGTYVDGDEEMEMQALQELAASHARIIFAVSDNLYRLLRMAKGMGLVGAGYVWMVFDLFSLQNIRTGMEEFGDSPADVRLMFEGLIRIVSTASGPRVDVFTEIYREALDSYVPGALGNVLDGPPPSEGNMVETIMGWGGFDAVDQVSTSWWGFSYDAVIMMCLAMASVGPALLDTEEWAPAVYSTMKATNFTGASAPEVYLDKFGDRDVSSVLFEIQNLVFPNTTDEGEAAALAAVDAARLRPAEIVQLRPGGGLNTTTITFTIWAEGRLQKPKDGFTCPSGYYFSDDLSCKPCPRGTFRSVYTLQCQPCPPGHFAETLATEGSCPSCGIRLNNDGLMIAYQPSKGSDMCIECPPNTRRMQGTAGLSIDECTCAPGSYILAHEEVDNRTGCRVCPQGGHCVGSQVREGVVMDAQGLHAHDIENVPPVNAKNYWGMETHPVRFHKCKNGQCAANWECEDGFRGRMCDICDDGFSLGGVCSPCPQTELEKWALTVGGAICIGIIWYVLEVKMAQTYDALDLLLLYLQLASIIQSFSLPWPNELTGWASVLGVMNFDVDYVSPQCLIPSWTATSGLVLQMILPLIVTGYNFLGYAIAKCRGKLDRLELEQLKDSKIHSSLSFTIVVYHTLCIKSFQSFMCEELADGSSFLIFNPSVTCWESEHIPLVLISILGAVFYVIGIPLYFLRILSNGKQANKMAQTRFLARYSFLYCRYEMDYYYWELVLLGRRFFFCLILVFFQYEAMLQAGLCVLGLTISVAGHYYARPFQVDRIDLADAVLIISLAFYVVAGMLFSDLETSNHAFGEVPELLSKDGVLGLLIVTNLIAAGVACIVVGLDIRHARLLASFISQFHAKFHELQLAETLQNRFPLSGIAVERAVLDNFDKDAIIGVQPSDQETILRHVCSKTYLPSSLFNVMLQNILETVPEGIKAADLVEVFWAAAHTAEVLRQLQHKAAAEQERSVFAEETEEQSTSGQRLRTWSPAQRLQWLQANTMPTVNEGALEAFAQFVGDIFDNSESSMVRLASTPRSPSEARSLRKRAKLVDFQSLQEELQYLATGVAVSDHLDNWSHLCDPEAIAAWREEAMARVGKASTKDSNGQVDRCTTGGRVSMRNLPTMNLTALIKSGETEEVLRELPNTFKPLKLYNWIKRGPSPSNLVAFAIMDDAMAQMLADTSTMSVFNSEQRTVFYHELLDTFPFLIDWLLQLTHEQRQQAYTMLESMYQCREKLAQRGGDHPHFNEVFQANDRAAFSYWLQSVTERTVTLVKELLLELTEAQWKGRSNSRSIGGIRASRRGIELTEIGITTNPLVAPSTPRTPRPSDLTSHPVMEPGEL